MRAVVQRVASAEVEVEGDIVGAIDAGLLVLAGLHQDDNERSMRWMAEKIANLRIFPDDEGRMNRSVLDARGSVLLVSNFTVAGDARKGRRPSFDAAMEPRRAETTFASFVEMVRALGPPVETGRFRAHMDVRLTNDGPVTIVLESPTP